MGYVTQHHVPRPARTALLLLLSLLPWLWLLPLLLLGGSTARTCLGAWAGGRSRLGRRARGGACRAAGRNTCSSSPACGGSCGAVLCLPLAGRSCGCGCWSS